MGDEEYEQTLLVVKECFVYKIPPRSTSAGYRAADWDLSSPLWTGRMVVIAKGEKCTIKLEDPNSGDLFAICPVTDTAVEPVSDSSRYFVVRIQDAGRHAFIGAGFAERSDAFDLSAALQDHKKYVKQRRESADAEKRLASQPKIDYSLAPDAKIHVEIKNHKSTSAYATSAAPSYSNAAVTGGVLLPPPPSSRRSQASTNTNTAKPSTTSGGNLDFWDNFTTTSSQPSTSTSTPSTSTSFGSGGWTAFQ